MNWLLSIFLSFFVLVRPVRALLFSVDLSSSGTKTALFDRSLIRSTFWSGGSQDDDGDDNSDDTNPIEPEPCSGAACCNGDFCCRDDDPYCSLDGFCFNLTDDSAEVYINRTFTLQTESYTYPFDMLLPTMDADELVFAIDVEGAATFSLNADPTAVELLKGQPREVILAYNQTEKQIGLVVGEVGVVVEQDTTQTEAILGSAEYTVSFSFVLGNATEQIICLDDEIV